MLPHYIEASYPYADSFFKWCKSGVTLLILCAETLCATMLWGDIVYLQRF